MSRQNKTKKSKKKLKLQGGLGVRLAVGILIGALLSLGGIFLYSRLPQAEPPTPVVQKIRISTYQDVKQIVEQELLAPGRSEGWRSLDQDGNLVRLQMYGEYPDATRLMELATRIALTDSPAQLDLAPRSGYVRILWQGETRLELRYRVAEEMRRLRPKVAIIMDDMGRNIAGFRNILALTLPVTPAILPQSSQATQGAAILKQEGHEYMIHLPMEPRKYPAVNPGPDPLLVSLDKSEMKRRIRLYQERVPGAVGGNNHMGSRFTVDRSAMHAVLEEMKAAGMFFVDSRTIGDSVAFDEARRMGMRTAQRNIFLDNEENVEYITGQLRKMIKIAEDKGEVIAICHPYSQTFQALRQNESWLRAQGVDFVLASALVKQYPVR